MSGDYEEMMREIQSRKNSDGYKVLLPEIAELLNMSVSFLKSRPDEVQEGICKAYVNLWYCDTDTIKRELSEILKINFSAEHDEEKQYKPVERIPQNHKHIIEANERKIKAIREEKIPKRQQKCKAHKNRIEKLTNKRNVVSHKLDRVAALNNVIRSFSVGHNKERREVFSNAMDKLNQASVKCLNDKKNALENRQYKTIRLAYGKV